MNKVFIAIYDDCAAIGLSIQAAYTELLKKREGILLKDVDFLEAKRVKVKLEIEKDE